jgi:putative zinc finger protein
MSCENVQERISSILDRRLPDAEQENVLAHIQSCRDCSAEWEAAQEMRSALRRLSGPSVPAALAGRLRVLASHEHARRVARVTFAARMALISDWISLMFDNAMRPLALPFAGGIVSALMIFGILVPTLTFTHAYADQALFTYADGEVMIYGPNGIYVPAQESDNAPRIERPDARTPETANVVDLTIDPNGRVWDWNVSRGELTPDLANIIMFGQFSPATNLGVPIPSKVKAVQIRNVQTAPIRVRS